MLFKDRNHAARALAERLLDYRGKNPLVLAIPRGAVPMAKIIAEALAGEFDVVLARKLGAPGNPEFAIGAIDESGWAYVSPDAELLGVGAAQLERLKAEQLAVIRQRRGEYSPRRPPIDPQGRVVIVVDDGLATGATMLAALHSLRARRPAELVCAVPVAPPDTLRRVAARADRVVCLASPADFRAVGQYYARFDQVSDDEVIDLLRQGVEAVSAPAPPLCPGDALLIVDVQNDFLPGGSLAVPDGDRVVPELKAWSARFAAAGLPVFATRDWHPPDHCSFVGRGGPWPPHCVAGSRGAEFAPGLALPATAQVVSKAVDAAADAYSGFAGTDLHERLQAFGVHRLFVGGLATDYCVLNTVRDACALGYRVLVLPAAIRAVDVKPGDGTRAIAAMRAAGAAMLGG